MNIIDLLILAPPILLALTFHEFAHAWTAYRYGDTTAQQMGRLTLNPLAHLDLMGTVMIFLVHFGWAKPVPVNPMNLSNPKRDMLWISLAGPLSNMLLALVSGLLLRTLLLAGLTPNQPGTTGLIFQMLWLSLQINLALAVFNILPVAPLDGSKILYGLLPPKYEHIIIPIEKYGPIVLIGLILLSYTSHFSVLGRLIWPFVNFFTRIFAGI